MIRKCNMPIQESNDDLMHYGIPGMKCGVRRYQNKDGTLTSAGRKRSNTSWRYQTQLYLNTTASFVTP